MLHILLFCVGIMYTPAPVNLFSLNNGLQRGFGTQIPFSAGVGLAVALTMMLTGYAGNAVANTPLLPFMALAGCAFVLYLAAKVLTARVDLNAPDAPPAARGFKDGLLMQALNPKSFMVAVPVGTLQFPAADIHGPAIAIWSVGLGLLAFGAPTLYAALGAAAGRKITHPALFRVFNLIMGILLIYVALDMAWEQALKPWLN